MYPRFLLVPVHTLPLLLLLMLMRPADACSPGRGYGRRRTGQRRSSPLVLGQHVPNTAEWSLAASGPAEGRIERDTDAFRRRLVVNDNADVVFKNDERNGDDLRMSVVRRRLDLLHRPNAITL